MKLSFLNSLIPGIIILTVVSCKKDEEKNYGTTTYKGKVIERGSTVTISNCPILIHGYEVVNPWGSLEGPEMPIIAETKSDSNGNYSITWEAQEGKSYYIYPESPKHLGNSRGQPVWELKEFGKTVTKDLEQWPAAYVKMKVLNRHKYDDYDYISFGGSLSGIQLRRGSKDTNYIATIWGNKPDTVSFGRKKGMIYTSVNRFGFNVRAWQMDSITIEY